MRIVLILLTLLVVAGGGFFYMQSSQLQNTPLGLMAGGTREITEMSRKFMEDLQYKDFKSASKYSLPEHKNLNIPSLLERLFQVKPEQLDINNVQILSTDIDSSGERARVRVQSDIKLLNTNEIRKPEMILYWKKLPDQKWYMDLATSLK